MLRSRLFVAFVGTFSLLLTLPALAQARRETSPQRGVWKQIDDLLGRKGNQESPGVWKYDLTRDDLHVKLNGAEIKPELALDGWLTFQNRPQKTRVMGELVLTADEVNPVIAKLHEGGVHVMALHNHLIGESPEVMYLHIMSEGEPLAVARAVQSALVLTKLPQHESEQKESLQGLDVAQIQRIIGGEKETSGSVLELTVGRRDRITDLGAPIPPAMEVESEAKFQSTGNGQALMYGEIVLTASEVAPVLRSLEQNGIKIMAVHNHMLTEQPRIFFVHCLGQGDAIKLARAMRATLDLTNSEKPNSAGTPR